MTNLNPYLTIPTTPPPPPAPNLLGDSGASGVFARAQDINILENVTPNSTVSIHFPNDTYATSIATGLYRPNNQIIPVPAAVFKDEDLRQTIIGLSPFCHDGQQILLTETTLDFIKDGDVLLRSYKKPTDTLWTIPRQATSTIPITHDTNQTKPIAAQVIHNEIDAAYVAFMSATLGSPPDDTLIRALQKGWCGNLPRLTAKMVRQNRPTSQATAAGHLDLQRKGQHLTKEHTYHKGREEEEPDIDDHDEDVLITRIDERPDNSNHSDASGRVPKASINGNSYILVSVYKKYIHLEAIKSRDKSEYIRAYRNTYAFFASHGHHPSCQRLDNETSDDLERMFRDDLKVSFQYVPTTCHRRNKAERAMRTMTNHLAAMMATTHPDFPQYLWDEMLLQAEITINMLRPYDGNTSICAYEGIFGHKYDFMAHPLAPVGTAVMVYTSPDQRENFASHGVPGFYIGPIINNYRSFRVYITHTKAFRSTDTLAWFPKPYYMPGSSATDQIQMAIKELELTMRKAADLDTSIEPMVAQLRISTNMYN
jgi:hypothetical protein